MMVQPEEIDSGVVCSRCWNCKTRTFYSSNFTVPVRGRDPEIKFYCPSCKHNNSLQFFSSPMNISELNILIIETDVFLDENNNKLKRKEINDIINNNEKEVTMIMAKKDKVEDCPTPAEANTPKRSVTEIRVEHANAVLGLLQTRGIPTSERCAVLSRAYNLCKPRKK